MRTVITTKGFKYESNEQEKIDALVNRLTLSLTKFKEDLPLLTFVLRKDKKVGSPQKVVSPFYYEGTITLQLPKKPLVAHVLRVTVIEAIEEAFMRIFKELDTYKGKHFKGHSKYMSKKTIKNLPIESQ